MKTSVLVIGAGPVGLTMAMDLAWRGIEVTVVEMRQRGEPPSVKCNHVSARSMEIFRRLGVARAIRDTGLPADYPNDAAFRTTTTGIEFGRIPIPCRADRYTAKGGPDTWWPTPEPPHRINQLFLEPVLFAHAASLPGVTILNRACLADFDQSPEQVTAIVENLDTGERTEIRCDYMVGCDGARSEVRRAIGANFTGDAVVQRTQSSYIRAPALMSLLRSPPAWANFSYNPRRSGNMFAIDGRETWLIHNYLRAGETDFDAVDRDLCIRAILGVGGDFNYEIISKEDWIPARRMIARHQFPRPPRFHLWRCRAYLGSVRGLWHECRHRGRHQPVVDARRGAARLGRARPARRARSRAAADHRTGFALCHGNRAWPCAAAGGGAGKHRSSGVGRRRRARALWGRGLRHQRCPALLRWAQLWLFL